MKIKNLGWNNDCDYGKVTNEKEEIIGYIIYNHLQILTETALFMKGKKLLENHIDPEYLYKNLLLLK